MRCLLRASNWGGSRRHCHNRCGTIKDPSCFKAVGPEHRPRFKSPSSAEGDIPLCVNYSWNVKQRTVNRLCTVTREIRFGFSLRIVTLSFTPSAQRLTMEQCCSCKGLGFVKSNPDIHVTCGLNYQTYHSNFICVHVRGKDDGKLVNEIKH